MQPEEGSGISGSISKAAQRVLCSPIMLSSIGAPACRSPAGAPVKPQADGAAEAPKRQGDESVGGVTGPAFALLGALTQCHGGKQ
jgi:hypothetical protein